MNLVSIYYSPELDSIGLVTYNDLNKINISVILKYNFELIGFFYE